MGSWLIFQHHLMYVMTEGVTQGDSLSLEVVQVQALRLTVRETRL